MDLNKCLIGFLLFFATTAFASKPSSPINIELSNLNPNSVSEFMIAITIYGRIDIDEVEFSITIDDMAEVISGELAWRGAIEKGVPIVRFLKLRNKMGVEQLQVHAEIKGHNQGMKHPYIDVAEIRLGTIHKPSTKTIITHKNSIVEYPAR